MAATLGPGETENGFVSAYAYGATASIACNNIDHDGAILRLGFKSCNHVVESFSGSPRLRRRPFPRPLAGVGDGNGCPWAGAARVLPPFLVHWQFLLYPGITRFRLIRGMRGNALGKPIDVTTLRCHDDISWHKRCLGWLMS
jgi:hypothetical protein